MKKWLVPLDDLDYNQRYFIFEEVKKNKNCWIKGFAGCGKSILLIYALKEKIEKNPNSNIAVIVFTNSLVNMFELALSELDIEYSCIRVMTYHKFKKQTSSFDYIFCDEIQDFPTSVLKEMKRRSNQLYVAGDSNQSIYECDPQTKEPVVESYEINSIIESKTYELVVNHRLSKSIINIVSELMPRMDFLEEKKSNVKEDISVGIYPSETEREEIKYIYKKAREATNADESTAIIFSNKIEVLKFVNAVLEEESKSRWNEMLNNYNRTNWGSMNGHLYNNNFNIEYIGSQYGDLNKCFRQNKIILMTYHSAKGLDFENVFLPFLNEQKKFDDETVFMVGITRSKRNLTLSYSGSMHKFLKRIEEKCENLKYEENIEVEDDFPF